MAPVDLLDLVDLGSIDIDMRYFLGAWRELVGHACNAIVKA